MQVSFSDCRLALGQSYSFTHSKKVIHSNFHKCGWFDLNLYPQQDRAASILPTSTGVLKQMFCLLKEVKANTAVSHDLRQLTSHPRWQPPSTASGLVDVYRGKAFYNQMGWFLFK